MSNLKYKHTAYTSAQWASLNPVIVENEIVIESDTKRTKIGNGISTYNQLEYADANSVGNYLGSIKPTDAAPTPARNGNYTFSIGGAKPAWLTAEAGVTEVKAGDGVAVVYTAPSTYSYTHVEAANSAATLIDNTTINSKNLFNKLAVLDGYLLATNDGHVASASNAAISDYIPVVALTDYYLSGLGIDFGLAYYNSDKTQIGSTAANDHKQFTTPANTAFVRFTVKYNSVSSYDTIQLELGLVKTAYIAYYSDTPVEKLGDNYLLAKYLQTLSGNMTIDQYLELKNYQVQSNYVSKNLYDKTTNIQRIISTTTYGTFVGVGSANARTTDYILVNEGFYVVKYKTANLPFNYGGWALMYNSSKVYQDYISDFHNGGYYYVDGDYTITIFKIPSGISYIIIQLDYNTIGDYDTIQFETGIIPNTYRPYLEPKYVKYNDIPTFTSYGKKAVFLGDSISYQNKWQPTIMKLIGLYYSVIELQIGLNGHSKTGVGGSMITPYITGNTGQTTGKSIYYRADDVYYYSPEIIFLFGGQNDSIIQTGGNIPLGTINDTPYSGGEVNSNPPSFYASYMGILLKLITQNPSAKIYCISPTFSTDQSYENKLLKVNAAKECANKYGVEFINLFTDLGINSINYATYLSDGVHPNSLGGLLIGNHVSKKLR